MQFLLHVHNAIHSVNGNTHWSGTTCALEDTMLFRRPNYISQNHSRKSPSLNRLSEPVFLYSVKELFFGNDTATDKEFTNIILYCQVSKVCKAQGVPQ